MSIFENMDFFKSLSDERKAIFDKVEMEFFEIEEEKPKTKKRKEHTLSEPRRRSMNDDDRDDFVAIDFETCTPCLTSAISVGMVKVIDAEIVQQFYSVINPVRDEMTDKEPNFKIHGISLETAEKSCTFKEIFEGIRLFIGDLPLVCHNKAADIRIIEALMEYYGLKGIRTDNAICTYQLSGKSLKKCCEEYGIPELRHHNALWDAEVCARIYLEILGKPIIEKGSVISALDIEKRAVNREHRVKLDEDKISNKDTIFFNSVVVITGLFDDYPERDELAALLQTLGAKVNSSISRRTTHVLLGRSAGPKKIETIKKLQEEGCEIQVLREHQLSDILKEIKP